MQQSAQGRAVCAVLKEVVHRGDPRDQLGRDLFLPVAGLHRIKYTDIQTLKHNSIKILFFFFFPHFVPLNPLDLLNDVYINSVKCIRNV